MILAIAATALFPTIPTVQTHVPLDMFRGGANLACWKAKDPAEPSEWQGFNFVWFKQDGLSNRIIVASVLKIDWINALTKITKISTPPKRAYDLTFEGPHPVSSKPMSITIRVDYDGGEMGLTIRSEGQEKNSPRIDFYQPCQNGPNPPSPL